MQVSSRKFREPSGNWTMVTSVQLGAQRLRDVCSQQDLIRFRHAWTSRRRLFAWTALALQNSRSARLVDRPTAMNAMAALSAK